MAKKYSGTKRGQIFGKTNGRCWYCGCELKPQVTFSVDHLVPRRHVRDNSITNLVPCCRSCNSKKGTDGVEELRRRMAGIPSFTFPQIEYLASIGITLPQVTEPLFYFEIAGLAS